MPFRDNSLSRLGTARGYLMWARERSETSQLGVRGMCCCVSESGPGRENDRVIVSQGWLGEDPVQCLTKAMRRATAGC